MFLYYITDRTQLSDNSETATRMLLDRITAAASAGIDAIQIREKDLPTRDLVNLSTKAAEIVRRENSLKSGKCVTRLLVNSRADVVVASGADGVHLRSDDIPPAEARSMFMQACVSQPVIAISCHTIREIELAEGWGADFAVFGPVFEKSGQPAPSGLTALRRACHRRAAKPAMPVLALGGVSLASAAECIAAGAAGIAGIRLFQCGNVGETITRLRDTEKHPR
ncbi:MAG TPA: thiamine phosphate synthase [Terriglobales bacterium]|nr:thiamine phosphate synthase [Terriglobales bacterium]